jgi:GDP-D-mannose dehydratase
MSNKKIIITGALGQDGKILSKLLIKKGFKVYGFTNLNNKSKLEKVKYKKVDLTNFNKIKNQISIINPTHIIHFGSSNPTFKNKNNFFKKNFVSSKNIIDAILRVNKKIQFIFPSSSQIFKKKRIVTEDDKFIISSSYTKFRIKIYDYMKSKKIKEELKFTNLILFNHDSIYRSKNFLFPRIFKAVKMNNLKFIKKIYKENLVGDFSHAEDICNAIYLLIKKNKCFDNLILSSKKITKVNDIINLIYKKKIKISFKKNKNYIIGDNSLAKKELGWKIKKNIFIAINELRKIYEK